MTTPTAFSNNTAAVLNETAADAKEAALFAARQAKYEFQKVKYEVEKAAQQTQKLAKENPLAAAATMFGIGALVGALAYKLLAPKPTFSRMLGINHLPDDARRQFSKQLKVLKKLF